MPLGAKCAPEGLRNRPAGRGREAMPFRGHRLVLEFLLRRITGRAASTRRKRDGEVLRSRAQAYAAIPRSQGRARCAPDGPPQVSIAATN